MKRKIALLLAAVMMATMVLTACSSKKEDEYAVVGLLVELTGSGAYTGIPPQLFLEDYFEEINANGGIQGKKLKLVAYDIAADNAVEGVNAANRLINEDKAIAILGCPSSAAAIPVGKICSDAKVPMISITATNEKVTVDEDGSLKPYAFRVCFIDPYQGTAGADYVYNEMSTTEVGIIELLGESYSQNICNCFQEQFEKLGGKVVKRIGVQGTDVEFRAPLTTLAEAGVKTVYVASGNYIIPAYLANQAAELGMDLKFVMPDGAYDDQLLAVAGENLEGALLTTGIFPNDPAFKTFQDEFVAKHPDWTANLFVLYTYDAMKLLEWSIDKAGSLDPAKIGEAMHTATDIELFTDKHFSVDPETNNPLNKTVSIIKVENGQFTLADSFKPGE